MQAVTTGLAVEYAGLTVIGHVREHNEDRLGWVALDGEPPYVTPAEKHAESNATVTSEIGLVFAVADGLGGYGGGEIASGMAVEASLDPDAARACPAGAGTGTPCGRPSTEPIMRSSTPRLPAEEAARCSPPSARS